MQLYTVGGRALPLATFRTWNSLPLYITSAHTISTDFQEEAEAIFVQLQFSVLFFVPTVETLFSA